MIILNETTECRFFYELEAIFVISSGWSQNLICDLRQIFRLSGEALAYLQEMIRWHIPRRTLGSSSALLLEVRRCKCTLGTRSFGYAGPTLWNDLPLEIRSAKDINCFKSLMKTYFFRLAKKFLTCKLSYFCTVPRILYIL